MANLLQVSSAFGRAMETIDRAKLCVLAIQRLNTLMIKHFNFEQNGNCSYCRRLFFPTNLDNDPPKGGLV